MAQVKIFHGSANSYLIGNILIDAPISVNFSRLSICKLLCIITHEHCDHFGGIEFLKGQIAASEACAKVINNKLESYSLCSMFDLCPPDKKVTRVLRENDVIEGEGTVLTVIETPGHAAGAICLYEADKKFLFSGDTVFHDYGMPRTDMPTGNPEKLKESYEKLASLDIRNIFPGHGKIINEKKYLQKLRQSAASFFF